MNERQKAKDGGAAAKELCDLITESGLSVGQASARLNIGVSGWGRMLAGEQDVPEGVLRDMRALAEDPKLPYAEWIVGEDEHGEAFISRLRRPRLVARLQTVGKVLVHDVSWLDGVPNNHEMILSRAQSVAEKIVNEWPEEEDGAAA